MEKKNKHFGKKEGEPRISVRPGNFIVPGEQPKAAAAPRAGADRPKANPQAGADRPKSNPQAPGTGAEHPKGNSGGGTHHGKRRNRHRGHKPTGQGAPAAAKAPEARTESVRAQEQPRQGRPQEGGKQSRHDRRDRRAQEAAPRIEVPSISPDLQHELDLQFSDTPSLGSFSPVRDAERRMAQSAVDTKEFEVDIATAGYLIDDVPCGFPTPDGKTVEVVGIRFRGSGKVYFFDPGHERFRLGEAAIVDTARGPEFGEVALLNRRMAEKYIIQPLRPVLRRATPEDVAHNEENRKREREALALCAEKIAAHRLDMHLVDAQYAFDNSKLLFYFTSEGRVDFRELVRDLAGVFRTRIELRQIGIRDESRLIGGLGMCGRPFCCSTFLSDFGQVSVKMAKEQGLSINTAKISGCCGRLMCCLRYEHESYAAEIALTPKKDARVMTPDGPGTVTEAAPLLGMVKVRLDSAAEQAPAPYHRDSVTVLDKSAAPTAAQTAAPTAASATTEDAEA